MFSRLVLIPVALALLGAAACGGSSSPPPTAYPSVPVDVSTTAAEASPSPTDDPAVAACFAKNKPNQPDILERTKVPGLPWAAIALGGGYAYNYRANECQSSVQIALAGVADKDGYCIQVAMAADNPGYNPDQTPARPLRHVIAAKGIC